MNLALVIEITFNEIICLWITKCDYRMRNNMLGQIKNLALRMNFYSLRVCSEPNRANAHVVRRQNHILARDSRINRPIIRRARISLLNISANEDSESRALQGICGASVTLCHLEELFFIGYNYKFPRSCVYGTRAAHCGGQNCTDLLGLNRLLLKFSCAFSCC